VRTRIKDLIGSSVAKVVVYLQRRGKYERRCWVWIIYHDGRWRRLFIDQDGTSVTLAAGEDEALEFDVVADQGWELTGAPWAHKITAVASGPPR
jgi:hypothetical protein